MMPGLRAMRAFKHFVHRGVETYFGARWASVSFQDELSLIKFVVLSWS
jgi:hypothetical protein